MQHDYSYDGGRILAGVGGGLAQLPLSDSAVITPMQIAMAMALAEIFDIKLEKSAAAAAIGAATTSLYRGG